MKKIEYNNLEKINGGTFLEGACVAVEIATVVSTVTVIFAPIGGLLAFTSGLCTGMQIGSWFEE